MISKEREDVQCAKAKWIYGGVGKMKEESRKLGRDHILKDLVNHIIKVIGLYIPEC